MKTYCDYHTAMRETKYGHRYSREGWGLSTLEFIHLIGDDEQACGIPVKTNGHVTAFLTQEDIQAKDWIER